MRVLMLSKACIVGIYQRKLEHIASAGVDLMAVVPPSWADERGVTHLERAYTDGYTLQVTPIRFNGNFHLHHYPALPALINKFKPDIVHIDEEPYNAATWQALYHARKVGAKTLFFSWQNIIRRYPPPFRWGERWVMNTVDAAIAGTESAAHVWQAKGYAGEMAVIPQFGTDTALFTPAKERPPRPFTLGYIGRLVPEKGVADLLHALASLPPEVQLHVVGGGPDRSRLGALADSLGVGRRVAWVEQVPSTEMPSHYHKIDVLVLPSHTRPNWKEQFGRVLVEAMASGVPVIGSDSGAIPDVIGDAGLIFPEGDVNALAAALCRLIDQPELHADLSQRGRARACSHFTHQRIAADTVALYQRLMSS